MNSCVVSSLNKVYRLNAATRPVCQVQKLWSSSDAPDKKKAKTPVGRLDDKWSGKSEEMDPQKRPVVSEEDAYKPFPNATNPKTGEVGGPRGPEPTRYGDWERKGRVIDF